MTWLGSNCDFGFQLTQFVDESDHPDVQEERAARLAAGARKEARTRKAKEAESTPKAKPVAKKGKGAKAKANNKRGTCHGDVVELGEQREPAKRNPLISVVAIGYQNTRGSGPNT